MTCSKCEHCKNKPAPFEVAMNLAGDSIAYALHFKDHPQFERINYPNRVAIGDYYLGIYLCEEAGPRLFVWDTDKPNAEALIYVSATTLGMVNFDAPPPMIPSDTLDDILTRFKALLNDHFFEG